MDLTRRLLRWGYARPHVLLAQAPDGASVRRAAERELARLGWAPASSAADADLLLVCGRPGPQLQEQLDRVWEQLPGPRTRTAVERADRLGPALELARADLLHLDRQRADARHREHPASGARDDAPDGGDTAAGGHDDMDMDMDMETDTGGAHDMRDMGGMDLPAGLGMAGTAPDRDGLELDELHVQLGPVLPQWPAGVVAEVTVQGDVTTALTLRRLDDAPPHPDPPGVGRVDRLVGVLELTGDARRARAARDLRDRAERGEPPDLAALRRALERDRVLRWSLRGLPSVGGPGELWAQLLQLCGNEEPEPGIAIDEAAQVLTGLELTAVRLVLAAAPPLEAARREDAHA